MVINTNNQTIINYHDKKFPRNNANPRIKVDMNEIFPVHTANEVIKSGKHRGKTFAEVYKEDPKYIDWLRNSNPHFKIDILSLSGASVDNEDIIGRPNTRLITSLLNNYSISSVSLENDKEWQNEVSLAIFPNVDEP